MHVPLPPVAPTMRRRYHGTLILNGGYDEPKAEQAIASGEADAIAFGVPFLANPDLVARIRTGAPKNAPDFTTLYTPTDEGYLDYPLRR